MRTKTLVIVALAFAAGGTCPSDVNNDGTVGINDFLAVLAAWGPCPSATVVDIEKDHANFTLRLWSDNRLEVRIDEFNVASCFTDCDEAWPQPFEWTQIDSPPAPPNAHPVEVDQYTSSLVILVAYSDGSVYRQHYAIDSAPGCSGNPRMGHCVFGLGPDGWELLP